MELHCCYLVTHIKDIGAIINLLKLFLIMLLSVLAQKGDTQNVMRHQRDEELCQCFSLNLTGTVISRSNSLLQCAPFSHVVMLCHFCRT